MNFFLRIRIFFLSFRRLCAAMDVLLLRVRPAGQAEDEEAHCDQAGDRRQELADADAIGTVYTVSASPTLNDYMCTTTLNEVLEDGMDVDEALQEAQDYLDMELD